MFAQIGSVDIPASPDALYPAVGMHSLGEEVFLDLNADWGMDDDDAQMIVDSHEEDWARLYDVKVTGTVSPWAALQSRWSCEKFNKSPQVSHFSQHQLQLKAESEAIKTGVWKLKLNLFLLFRLLSISEWKTLTYMGNPIQILNLLVKYDVSELYWDRINEKKVYI